MARRKNTQIHHVDFAKVNRRWVAYIYIDPNTTISQQTVGSKKNVDKIIKTQLEPQGIPYTIEGMTEMTNYPTYMVKAGLVPNSRHGSYPGDTGKIPKTKAAFKKEYYGLLTKYFGMRHYIGAGKYEMPTAASRKIGARLAELYDAHPSWADDIDDQWGDDQRMNHNPRRKNGDRNAPHGLSKAEEKTVRSRIQQASRMVFAFMRVLKQRPRETGPSNLEAHKIGWGFELLNVYQSENTTGNIPKLRREYFGSSSLAPLKARKWLNSVNDSRWETIIRAAAKEAIERHKAKSNPKRRKNAKSSRSNLVFFMETRGGKYNVKVYKVGKKYKVVIHERGVADQTGETTSKAEVRAVVGQFHKVGYMTGTAKYKVKHDALGLGIE